MTDSDVTPMTGVPTPPPPDDASQVIRDDAVLSLRPTLERLYCEAKRAQSDGRRAHEDGSKKAEALLNALIRCSDAYEDAFRTVEKIGRRTRDSDVDAAFRVGYVALLDALEAQQVYQVPVLGLRYDEVQFNGMRIDQPWEVAGKSGAAVDRREDRRVKEVLRSLWVATDGRPRIIRRAQVMY